MSLLYDGECRFCMAGSERLVRLGKPGVIRRVSSRDDAEIGRFPESVRAALKSSLQLVSPDGDVASGAEAIARALNTRGLWKLCTWVYWIPGIRQVVDGLYVIVARNRYRIAGRAGACESGACKMP